MTAQDYLPKEPLDLPTDLPKEIPAYTGGEGKHDNHTHHAENENVKTLLEWHAPGRPFRKRNKEYYVNSLLIMLLVEIILFLFSQYVLMLLVVSFVFLAFVMATVPPHDFRYRISTEGLTIEDHFFLWQELYDFYFKKVNGIEVLHIRTMAFLPGELTLILGSVDRDYIQKILLPYLPYREVVKQTFVEKSGDWLSKNFPLERNHHS